eukprot:scaffold167293_cov35-Tisochrysis_lutea.AAC.2
MGQLTFESAMTKAIFGSFSGTCSVAKGGRQSMRSACPSRPHAEMNWSMIPHGVPQYSCSHFWQSSALSFGSTRRL